MFKLQVSRFLLRKNKNSFIVFILLANLIGIFYCILLFSKRHKEGHLPERHVGLKSGCRYNCNWSRIGVKDYPIVENYERLDWHDYEFMKIESERTGFGEKGEGFKFTDPKDVELDSKIGEDEGLHVLVSDKISVNRSVIDTRPEK